MHATHGAPSPPPLPEVTRYAFSPTVYTSDGSQTGSDVDCTGLETSDALWAQIKTYDECRAQTIAYFSEAGSESFREWPAAACFVTGDGTADTANVARLRRSAPSPTARPTG